MALGAPGLEEVGALLGVTYTQDEASATCGLMFYSASFRYAMRRVEPSKRSTQASSEAPPTGSRPTDGKAREVRRRLKCRRHHDGLGDGQARRAGVGDPPESPDAREPAAGFADSRSLFVGPNGETESKHERTGDGGKGPTRTDRHFDGGVERRQDKKLEEAKACWRRKELLGPI